MKSVQEMLAIMQSSLFVQKSIEPVIPQSAQWIKVKAEIAKIPPLVSSAIEYVANRDGVKKITIQRSAGLITRYTRGIYGYEFLFEVQHHSEKGIVRVCAYLFDGPENTVFIRDFLRDEINSI